MYLKIESSKDYSVINEPEDNKVFYKLDKSRVIDGINAYLKAIKYIDEVAYPEVCRILKEAFKNQKTNGNFLNLNDIYWEDKMSHDDDDNDDDDNFYDEEYNSFMSCHNLELKVVNPINNASKVFSFFNGYTEKKFKKYLVGFNPEFIYACSYYLEDIESSELFKHNCYLDGMEINELNIRTE